MVTSLKKTGVLGTLSLQRYKQTHLTKKADEPIFWPDDTFDYFAELRKWELHCQSRPRPRARIELAERWIQVPAKKKNSLSLQNSKQKLSFRVQNRTNEARSWRRARKTRDEGRRLKKPTLLGVSRNPRPPRANLHSPTKRDKLMPVLQANHLGAAGILHEYIWQVDAIILWS